MHWLECFSVAKTDTCMCVCVPGLQNTTPLQVTMIVTRIAVLKLSIFLCP